LLPLLNYLEIHILVHLRDMFSAGFKHFSVTSFSAMTADLFTRLQHSEQDDGAQWREDGNQHTTST
jgi:hypothetical protein